MRLMKKHQRSFVSLLTAFSFVVVAVTGILAFVRPFSIGVVGLHALTGFVFVGLIAFHVANNLNHLSRYVRSKVLWLTLAITSGLTGLFLWQPDPIQSVLALSQNLGPATDQFEMNDDGLVYQYSPADHYKMALTIRAGKAFDVKTPPHVAIWLENASFYHIKTLHEPRDLKAGRAALSYWDFKVRGWEEAKRKAAASGKDLREETDVDGVSGATRNSSFDPADYILPTNTEESLPYRLLIELPIWHHGLQIRGDAYSFLRFLLFLITRAARSWESSLLSSPEGILTRGRSGHKGQYGIVRHESSGSFRLSSRRISFQHLITFCD